MQGCRPKLKPVITTLSCERKTPGKLLLIICKSTNFLYTTEKTVIQWLATFYLHGTRSEMTCRNGKYRSRERAALARRWLIKHEIATITDGTCSLISLLSMISSEHRLHYSRLAHLNTLTH